MKVLILLSCCLLAACGNSSPSGQTAAITGITAPEAIIDPVCGMIKDSTWTDYSLYHGDTVWFCAGKEKLAFDAQPEKYMNPKH